MYKMDTLRDRVEIIAHGTYLERKGFEVKRVISNWLEDNR